MPSSTDPLNLAIIGAGPVGLALGLQLARRLPDARITLFDARNKSACVASDGRTLALSLGSVQSLQRLLVWPQMAALASPITAVHVSQQRPSFWGFASTWAPEAVLHIRAADQGVSQLGAVLSYGNLVAPLQTAWLSACDREPHRLSNRFGTRVQDLKSLPHGVEVDAGVVDSFDLAVVAEGGVFSEQVRKQCSHSYHQTAWVGQLSLEGGTRGVAYERFTSHGPAALLPLADSSTGLQRAALVWCVNSADDPVLQLDEPQRLAVLNTLFAPGTGRITDVSALKAFPLGLKVERHVVHGRTVRIGNAAQTLHPVAGQGLNLGLRDAHELSCTLAQSGPLDARLRALQSQRALDRWAMIGATDFLARSFTWSLPGLHTLRGLGLAALERASPLKSRLAQHMMFGSR